MKSIIFIIGIMKFSTKKKTYLSVSKEMYNKNIERHFSKYLICFFFLVKTLNFFLFSLSLRQQ